MTNRMIENRVMKMQELEQQKAKLEAEIERLKGELKTDLEEKNLTVIKTERGITVRWQEVVSEKFDSKAFKADNPDEYAKYLKPSVSHRFTWNA